MVAPPAVEKKEEPKKTAEPKLEKPVEAPEVTKKADQVPEVTKPKNNNHFAID